MKCHGGRRTKKGLRVGHSDGLVKATRSKGTQHGVHYDRQPDGWYVYVFVNNNHKAEWRAILGLRFARQQDALVAAAALTKAGLDSFGKLKVADAMRVREIATTDLQW